MHVATAKLEGVLGRGAGILTAAYNLIYFINTYIASQKIRRYHPMVFFSFRSEQAIHFRNVLLLDAKRNYAMHILYIKGIIKNEDMPSEKTITTNSNNCQQFGEQFGEHRLCNSDMTYEHTYGHVANNSRHPLQ